MFASVCPTVDHASICYLQLHRWSINPASDSLLVMHVMKVSSPTKSRKRLITILNSILLHSMLRIRFSLHICPRSLLIQTVSCSQFLFKIRLQFKFVLALSASLSSICHHFRGPIVLLFFTETLQPGVQLTMSHWLKLIYILITTPSEKF